MSLRKYVSSDLNEIKEGSRKISDKHNLLVFVHNNHGDGMPWLARIKNGQVTDSVSLSDMGIRSSDGHALSKGEPRITTKPKQTIRICRTRQKKQLSYYVDFHFC